MSASSAVALIAKRQLALWWRGNIELRHAVFQPYSKSRLGTFRSHKVAGPACGPLSPLAPVTQLVIGHLVRVANSSSAESAEFQSSRHLTEAPLGLLSSLTLSSRQKRWCSIYGPWGTCFLHPQSRLLAAPGSGQCPAYFTQRRWMTCPSKWSALPAKVKVLSTRNGTPPTKANSAPTAEGPARSLSARRTTCKYRRRTRGWTQFWRVQSPQNWNSPRPINTSHLSFSQNSWKFRDLWETKLHLAC